MSMEELTVYGGGMPAVQTQATGAEMMVSRQTQEVQAAMVIAQKFPRNVDASYTRIMQSCKRKSLAERAMYEYPRGGENVTGPSIRLAEMLAQNWGNIDFGIVELAQRPGESEVMSYCWDLETNTRQTKIFTVPHVRQTKKGAKALTDPRDIYEMVANQGARRLRACILGVIPGDIVDAALQECNKTLRSDKEPLADRVRKMVAVFQNDMGIPMECLEQYIGCKTSAFTEQSIVRLRGVYTAIAEGRANREDYFALPTADRLEAPSVDANTGEVITPQAAEKSAGAAAEAPQAVSMNDL